MNKQTIGAFFAGFLSLAVIPTAQAGLFDRGGGLIYDDFFDITWLQDANYCATNPTLCGGQC